MYKLIKMIPLIAIGFIVYGIILFDWIAVILGLILFGSFQANAVTGTAAANATIISAISIAQVSDLEFGSAPQGDAAKTVAPGTSEDAENASFNVSGEASTAYTISVPADGSVVMQTGGGGANETIAVDSFISYPAAGANGLLDGTGGQLLLIGATRSALGATQVTGSYTTNFTVDVVY